MPGVQPGAEDGWSTISNGHPERTRPLSTQLKHDPRGAVLEAAILCLTTQPTYSVWSGLGQTAPWVDVNRHAGFLPISSDRRPVRPLWLPAQKRRFA